MTTPPKTRPILFSAPMVLALLDGRKTQTRRIAPLTDAGRVKLGARNWHPDDPEAVRACPYGQPGDKLSVSETWQYADWTEQGIPIIRYRADRAELIASKIHIDDATRENLANTWAELSDPDNYTIDGRAADRRWRSPIFMPRFASRLLLEITDVRLQRLYDVTETDARAEGANYHDGLDVGHSGWRHDSGDVYCSALDSFSGLWNKIHGRNAWLKNPWVWAVTFNALSRPA